MGQTKGPKLEATDSVAQERFMGEIWKGSNQNFIIFGWIKNYQACVLCSVEATDIIF